MAKLACVLVVLSLVITMGCSGDDAPAEEPAAVSPGDAPPASDPTPTMPTPAEPPGGPVAKRCGAPAEPARWMELRGPAPDRLAGVVVGRGPVTAVFSHQGDELGLCGF